jgi:hypothetical protein
MSHSAAAKPTTKAVRALLGLGLAGTAVVLVATYVSQPKAAAGTLTRAMHAPGATAPVAASTTAMTPRVRPSTISWLAAGDSYASGAGLTKTTKLCARAPGTRADPSMAWAVVASRSKILAKDHFGVPVLVACTGAKTGEFFKSQGKSPAEWTPSMGRYDLVTFSFGGDDIGFASIIQSCYEHTSECSNGTVRSRISALGRAFPGFLIRVARSVVVSGGNVVVMGYPELIEDPSLWPQINRDTHQCQGIDTNTSKSIRGWAGALNAAIGSAVDTVNARPAAERNGVHFTFVDIVTGQSSEGISRSNPDLFEPATGVRHELCSQGDKAWLNGLTIHLSTRSMHPNQAGEDAMGNLAAEVIRRLDWSRLSSPKPVAPVAVATVTLLASACPTTYATPAAQIEPVPTSVSVKVPLSVAREASSLEAFIAPGAGTVVAPRGWKCMAQVGSDASSSVNIGETSNLGPRATGPFVAASFIPGCLGCVFDQACPYFPAKIMAPWAGNGPCPTVLPRSVRVRLFGRHVAEYMSSAGAQPWQNGYAAQGAVTLFPSFSLSWPSGSDWESCALPEDDHALCTFTVAAFISQYG